MIIKYFENYLMEILNIKSFLTIDKKINKYVLSLYDSILRDRRILLHNMVDRDDFNIENYPEDLKFYYKISNIILDNLSLIYLDDSEFYINSIVDKITNEIYNYIRILKNYYEFKEYLNERNLTHAARTKMGGSVQRTFLFPTK